MNVAIVQAHLEWENVPVNLKLFNKRIAAIEGANIIVLPEMFASGFTMKERTGSAFLRSCLPVYAGMG